MTQRSTLKHTLAAALAASALVAGPAVAKPMDNGPAASGNRSEMQTGSLAGTTDQTPAQDLRGEHARDAARAQIAPGQPTWPADPTPLLAPAAPAKASSSGGGSDDTVWLVLGIGLAGAGIVAGSAAGVARRSKVRARRVAV
jgi:hypothetical protein